MLKHNLKLFFRNIKKHKSSFLINSIGLSIGLACVLLITLWVIDEMNMDKFHEKDDHLAQILQNTQTPNGIETEEYTPGPLAKALVEEFPEVENSVSVVPYEWFEGEQFMLSDGSERIFASRNQFASKDYFTIFSYHLVHGDKEQVLDDINSIVISEEMAEKLFSTTNAIGRTVEWIHDEFGGTYKVSGIFANLPAISTDQFDAVFNFDVFIEENDNLREWNNSDPYTYVTLKPNINISEFNAKIRNFLNAKNKNPGETLFAQLYSDTYLYGNYENGKPSGGRIAYIRLFSIIALLILIIACVNFINLSTAKASTRIKEIGVKKVIGAVRKNLMAQYLTESVLMTFISLMFALVIVVLLLPQFNSISGKEIVLTLSSNLIVSILIIVLLTALLSGMYPAFYLSGFSVLNGLKGKADKSVGGGLIRKGLVVFQFSISIVLIASVIIIYKQIEFIQSKNLGYNKDNTIQFRMGMREIGRDEGGEVSEEDIENFLQVLKNTPGVVNATNYAYFIDDFGTTPDISWAGKSADEEILFGNVAAGYDFVETMGVEMKEGRSFSRNYKTDIDKIIFNETAIAAMGLENPIGKVVSLWGEEKEIIGVMGDFHFDRLYEKIQPLFIKLTTGSFASNIIVKIQAGNEAVMVDRIKEAYQDYFIEGMPFEFKFVEDKYQALYQSEKRVATLSKYFAGLAILISCLGLFGLATFTAQRRRKEISIRKVLGQSASQIMLMLSSEFAKLILVSILIALPIAYLLTSNWLSGFAYRIPLKFWHFLGAGIVALLIAMLTVGSQAVKAANENPVDGLIEE